MDILQQLTEDLQLKFSQIAQTLALLEQGATVPFIARYRKERTGNLDEERIRELAARFRFYSDLESRKNTVLESIRSQGKLTPALEARIQAVLSRSELEDLYLPFRPKRATRASRARKAGLGPLAKRLTVLDRNNIDLNREASGFLNPKLGIKTTRQALQGACDILAEGLNEDIGVRKWLRKMALRDGLLHSKVRKAYSDQKTKYSLYYRFQEPAGRIPSHRFLALLRGEKEGVLRLKLELPADNILPSLEKRLIRHPQSAAAQLLKETARDALERLLSPAMETETRKLLREKAETEAIRVFSENLRELLLAPPAGRKPVLGIDPGFRTGCKTVALDGTGKFLEYRTIFPNEPQNARARAAHELREMIRSHHIELIAIGNGTAGRETSDFVRDALRDLSDDERPIPIMVSEAGASVYSASPMAREEFPDFDATVRGAISIGRRLQDPLSELVKIEPRSIGVGQYQHDVSQTRQRHSLEDVVESCVNRVGVDINLASVELLKYVSGLNRKTAAALIEHRDLRGPFEIREDLREVMGLGDRSFEQAAGFLRIPGGCHPLDDSAVHPERYDLVESMAAAVKTSLSDLIGNAKAIKRIPIKRFVTTDVGMPTLRDIQKELEKPGRDPRSSFSTARFSEDVREPGDLTPGMILEGSVTNVTNFGAFVDIGVHQGGLIHISQIADCYVDDPRRFIHVGQVVRVKVLAVDSELNRISLSLLLT